MSLYDPTGGINLLVRGEALRCPYCGGSEFTVRHIHNPYGHDMCEAEARCDGCSRDVARDYVGRFEEVNADRNVKP
jgi:hypothetical protein